MCAGQGMCMAVTGPTLLDLQKVVGTDTEQIAVLYTARSAGYLAGSLIGGLVFDATQRKQSILTTVNFLMSAAALAIPWSRSIGALTGTMVANGVAMGVLDTGSNVCCLNYWGKDSGPFYQALHFTYGLGGLIAPLIAAPFLGNFESSELINLITNETVTNASYYNFVTLTNQSTALLGTQDDRYSIVGEIESDFINNQTSEYIHAFPENSPTAVVTRSLPNATFEWRDSQGSLDIPTITYAYSIIGGLGFLVSFLFLATTVVSPIDEKPQMSKSAEARQPGRSFVLFLVFLTFLLLFVETGTEIGFAQMLTTYAVKGSLKLSKITGSYMTSVFWAAFTLSRFASIFLAIRVSNLSMLMFDLVATSAGALVLLFLAATHEWALWLGTVLLGTGIASFFPAAVAWLEEYIACTNKIVSIFAVGAAFGEMVVPYTISCSIEEVPEILVYVVAASCSLSAVLVAVLFLVLRGRQKKYAADEKGVACDADPSLHI